MPLDSNDKFSELILLDMAAFCFLYIVILLQHVDMVCSTLSVMTSGGDSGYAQGSSYDSSLPSGGGGGANSQGYGGQRFHIVDADYNQVRPQEGGSTDYVDMGMFVNSVRSVSEMDMTLKLDVFLQGSWTDERLIPYWHRLYTSIYNIEHANCTNELCNMTTFTLGKEFSNQIWRPDFYISNAVNIMQADDINDNVCVKFSSNGEIFYSHRVIVTVSCIMKLALFPFDSHICSTCTGSYKYHDGLMMLRWNQELSGIYEDQNTANFLVQDLITRNWNKTALYLGGNFTEHCYDVTINRKYNIFIVTLYLPSVSLVILSWVNFWVDPKAIPARAGLSITAILAQITLICGTANRFPSVSDLKMSDLYVTLNFIYTFATLIEFAIVSYQKPDDTGGGPRALARRLSRAIRSESSHNPSRSSRKSHCQAKRLQESNDISPEVANNSLGGLRSLSIQGNGGVIVSCDECACRQCRGGVDPIAASTIVCNEEVVQRENIKILGGGNCHLHYQFGTGSTVVGNHVHHQLQQPHYRNAEVVGGIRNHTSSLHIGTSGVPVRKVFNDNKKRKVKKKNSIKIPSINFKQADEFSKVLFPLTFIIWNGIFFTVNLIWADKISLQALRNLFSG